MKTSQKSISQQSIDLLRHCQRLQSEQDGIHRPEPGHAGVAADETLDDFAQQIQTASVYASMTDRLLAMQTRLADLGRQLESRELVEVPVGGDYADAALDWLSAQAGSPAPQGDQN
ncbi:hypothetical protein [Lelliottia wanjuensis]|uniref:hypothetical protein n=1 Tax=Lelliottia wanjuensis TaxID=3050585 RepID=UPI00255024AA|nr:hypothetical protein [Lelliottia sp. V104_15]MDK9604599.1 hypothetical protein [Lelliottia sp. V104_15]